MRFRLPNRLLATLAASGLAAGAAVAQAPTEALPLLDEPAIVDGDLGGDLGGELGAEIGGEAAPSSRDPQLDRLYRRLAEAENESEARGVALLIQRRWMRSGSDTADLLMRRAQDAMRESDAALAIELIDRVIALEPDWAEAWHRRAMAFMVMEDPIAAVADIYRTLTLEPRHYAAWTGLGGIFLRAGDEEGALESFRRALDAHPHQPRIRAVVDRLERNVDGIDL